MEVFGHLPVLIIRRAEEEGRHVSITYRPALSQCVFCTCLHIIVLWLFGYCKQMIWISLILNKLFGSG